VKFPHITRKISKNRLLKAGTIVALDMSQIFIARPLNPVGAVPIKKGKVIEVNIRRQTMKVLIATDGSEYGKAAVSAAAERPWPPGTNLRVLTVMERPAISYITGGERELDLNYNQLAAEEIIDEAKEWGADLILLGTHGRHGIKRFILGSVARIVATHAPCSVEVVRRGE